MCDFGMVQRDDGEDDWVKHFIRYEHKSLQIWQSTTVQNQLIIQFYNHFLTKNIYVTKNRKFQESIISCKIK